LCAAADVSRLFRKVDGRFSPIHAHWKRSALHDSARLNFCLWQTLSCWLPKEHAALARSATHFYLQANCSCVRNAVCYCSRRSIFRGICRAFCKVTEMLSINGTAIHLTQREFHRAAAGCPMISGRRLLAVAKNYRDFATELDR